MNTVADLVYLFFILNMLIFLKTTTHPYSLVLTVYTSLSVKNLAWRIS